jgi:hypothetical protein
MGNIEDYCFFGKNEGKINGGHFEEETKMKSNKKFVWRRPGKKMARGNNLAILSANKWQWHNIIFEFGMK